MQELCLRVCPNVRQGCGDFHTPIRPWLGSLQGDINALTLHVGKVDSRSLRAALPPKEPWVLGIESKSLPKLEDTCKEGKAGI